MSKEERVSMGFESVERSNLIGQKNLRTWPIAVIYGLVPFYLVESLLWSSSWFSSFTMFMVVVTCFVAFVAAFRRNVDRSFSFIVDGGYFALAVCTIALTVRVPQTFDDSYEWVVVSKEGIKTTFNEHSFFFSPATQVWKFEKNTVVRTTAVGTTADHHRVHAELFADVQLDQDEDCMQHFVHDMHAFNPQDAYRRQIQLRMAFAFMRTVSKVSENVLRNRLSADKAFSFADHGKESYLGCKLDGVPFIGKEIWFESVEFEK